MISNKINILSKRKGTMKGGIRRLHDCVETRKYLIRYIFRFWETWKWISCEIMVLPVIMFISGLERNQES